MMPMLYLRSVKAPEKISAFMTPMHIRSTELTADPVSQISNTVAQNCPLSVRQNQRLTLFFEYIYGSKMYYWQGDENGHRK